MKANKRIRDLNRRSPYRLYIDTKEGRFHVTTQPVSGGKKDNDVRWKLR